tara:strand:+ start:57 stop:536 length:480 start_codon:yes stop_codon:yes gene_type:complete
LDEFYETRLQFYQKRKDYILSKIKYDLDILKEKVRFINDVINGDVIVNNKTKAQINEQLEKRKYMKVSSVKGDEDGNYNYLISMPIYNLSKEKRIELETEYSNKDSEYKDLYSKTIKDLWKTELEYFVIKYEQFKKEKSSIDISSGKTVIKRKKKPKTA